MVLYSSSISAQKLSLCLKDPAVGSWGWVGAIPGAFRLGSGRQLGSAAVCCLEHRICPFWVLFLVFFSQVSERLLLVAFSSWEGYFWHFGSLLVPTECEIQQFGI